MAVYISNIKYVLYIWVDDGLLDAYPVNQKVPMTQNWDENVLLTCIAWVDIALIKYCEYTFLTKLNDSLKCGTCSIQWHSGTSSTIIIIDSINNNK